MMKLPQLASCILASGLLASSANAAVLVGGTQIGIDFGRAGTTNNFNGAATGSAAAGSLAAGAVNDLTATVVDGVGFAWTAGNFNSDFAAGHTANPNGGTAVANLPGVYDDSNLWDWMDATSNAPLTLTFSGLNDSLTYDLNIGQAWNINTANTNSTYAVDGQSATNAHDSTTGGAYLDFTGLSTDGSGNLVITVTASGGTDAAVSALVLTTVPEPSSAALLGLGGLALILRRRK